jgi:uncharacterized membrane protein YphA (DoxX/SURF4 family)
MTRITGLACFFLVALRLAIGWHFLVEGAHKIETHRIGKTATNTPWTGEAFFREGTGPAARYFRDILHLDDQDARARLECKDHVLPTPVNNEWDDYFQRFVDHFELSNEQKGEAAARLADAKKKTADWLSGDVPSEVKKTFVWGSETVKQTVPQRLGEYSKKAEVVSEALDRRLPAFNQDVEKVRLRTAKTEATAILTGLLNDLISRTAEMKRSLDGVLTPPQKEKGPVPDAPAHQPIEWLDKATMCAHAVLGACLLLGLFSRLASFLLALFLLSVTLVAPALPYSPTPPGAIGFYLYVNLYVIEMLALLALACMPTGRWFGVDALLHYFTHGRRRVRLVVVTDFDPHHQVRI